MTVIASSSPKGARDVQPSFAFKRKLVASTVWGVGVSYSGDLSGVALTAGLADAPTARADPAA